MLQIKEPVGKSIDDLFIPALVINLPNLAYNIRTMDRYCREKGKQLRPHVKMHESTDIAKMQVQDSESSNGIATATLGQALVMFEEGVTDDIMITGLVRDEPRMQILADLAGQSDKIRVAAYQEPHIKKLSEVMQGNGVELGVLINVDARLNRCGVKNIEDAKRLYCLVGSLPGLRFDGLTSYEGDIQENGDKKKSNLQKE